MGAGAVRKGPFYRRIFAHLGRFEDGAILRAAFFAMLAGTIGVLYVDFSELGEADLSGYVSPALPALPGLDPSRPAGPLPSPTSVNQALQQPLVMSLVAGGVLELTGSIDLGAAERFVAEVEARGEYVKTVALNSPGGSVADALEMGAQIRRHGFATAVAAGALCASSCPLVLAGGVERSVSRSASIGIHQVYAAPSSGDGLLAARPGGIAMQDAQKTTALITRHLIELGVDAAVWLHALETPPSELYFLTPEQLISVKFATIISDN